MRTTILFILAMLSLKLMAQDSTAETQSNGVLIVNYEPRMYRSTIDPVLMTHNDLSYDELRKQVRKGLDDNLFLECKAHGRVVSMMREDTSLYSGKLAKLHSQVNYKYVPLGNEPTPGQADQKEKPLDKLGSKFDKLVNRKKSSSPEEAKMGTWVEDGQVKSRIDNREKFMQTHINNVSIVKNLCQEYRVQKVIFINQLDIFETTDEGDEGRKIKVHYTVFNDLGVMTSSGAEYAWFSSHENKLRVITSDKLYPICHTIAAKP